MLPGGADEHATADPPVTDVSAADVAATAVVVLAAGEGTRMRSTLPKVLHPLAGRPLVEHAVRTAAGLEPEHLIVVIGHGREAVGAHLESVATALGRKIDAAVQAQQQGTGHAVACGLEMLPAAAAGTVVVTYGDVPLLDTATVADLLGAHHKASNAVTVLTAAVADPTGYGRIVRDRDGSVARIVEHRDATAAERDTREVNSGVYAFDLAMLRGALDRLGAANEQGERYLTDVLALARGDGLPVGAVTCSDQWLVEGVNDRVQLATLGAECNRRLLDAAMRSGVTVIDPGSVWLDADVVLERDVVLHPGVQLRGGTALGEGCEVGPDTTLDGCVVGAGATVIRTHAIGAEIGPGAAVGPYAYLRPGSRLGPQSKVGTFVETKNAELAEGAKVPHLTYAGDATIGAGSNIGAATVFVNYDGVSKHHTTIGDHARTGADNMFVAPVTVGDGAYTAAGSVITEDVPPGAMAVARARQRNVTGWVARRRPGTPAAEAAAKADIPDDVPPTEKDA